MISSERKFLFIHVPKTGGNSIQTILRNYSDDEILATKEYQDGIERFQVWNSTLKLSKHSTLNDYRSKLGDEQLSRLFKFATIRNPWDMMISFYLSPHRGVRDWNRGDFIQLLEKVPTLDDYICLRDSPLKRLINRLHVSLDNRPLDSDIDHLLRFEYLEQDFSDICHKIGIPAVSLPRRNASIRNDYRQYYDEETCEMVRLKFAKEIAFGGYRFDGEKR